jgi:hypothetical protein
MILKLTIPTISFHAHTLVFTQNARLYEREEVKAILLEAKN